MKNNICIRPLADLQLIASCKISLSSIESPLDRLAEILHLAGNPVRLRILFLLSKEDNLCVCDMSDVLGMSISAISQHLRKLRDKGLIVRRRVGQTIYYSTVDTYRELLTNLLDCMQSEDPSITNKSVHGSAGVGSH